MNNGLGEFIEGLLPRLVASGFRLVDHLDKGPMGSARWLFASDHVDLEVLSDRGSPAACAGLHGGPTYAPQTWGDVLGIDVPDEMGVDDQVEFFLTHLDRINDDAIALGTVLDDCLRDANWERVKVRLGLDPQMPRPGSA